MDPDSDNETSNVPLFIKEDDQSSEAGGGDLLRSSSHSDHTSMGVNLGQWSIGPYIKEMFDLLKNCEEVTGMGKNEANVYSQEYLSTSCTDTEVEISKEVQPQQSGFDICVSSAMPLTSAGNELSESMAEYEGQLMDMLAMLESSEEESSMEYKPQDCSPNEEYVHIPKLFKETAKTARESNTSTTLAATMDCDHQSSTSEVYSRKRAARTIIQSVYNSDNSKGLTVQSPEKCTDGDNVEDTLKPQLRTKTEQIMCEATYTDEECKNKAASNSDLFHEVKVDMTDLSCGWSELQSLGPKLEMVIDEIQCLVQKRKELESEVMMLHGYNQLEHTTETKEKEEEEDKNEAYAKVAQLILRRKEEQHIQGENSKREIEKSRHEHAEEERKLWRVNVERQSLQNELWRLKRKLFVIAMECTRSQATLRSQQQHVEILKREEEKLQTAEMQLREDSNKLQLEHKQQLLKLQEQFDLITSNHLSNTQEELNQSRRDLCGDIQQYLQDSLKAMEERYEPILAALLKRRDAAGDALAKVKEQTQELRGQVTPLREEIQKLTLQKVCLEEKLRLISFQRKEETGQYKEMVNSLEESSRELKIQLGIQNTKTNEMKELKERLNKKLAAYRSAIEDHVTRDEETTS